MAYHVREYSTDIDGRRFPPEPSESFPDYRSARQYANEVYEMLSGDPYTRSMRHEVKIYDGTRLVDTMVWEGERAPSRTRNTTYKGRAMVRKSGTKKSDDFVLRNISDDEYIRMNKVEDARKYGRKLGFSNLVCDDFATKIYNHEIGQIFDFKGKKFSVLDDSYAGYSRATKSKTAKKKTACRRS